MLLCLAAVQMVLAFSVWGKQHVPGLRAFAWLMATVAFYVACYALELAPSLRAYAGHLKNLEFVGIVFIAPLTIVFYATYTGRDAWLRPSVRVGLFALALLNLALKWTDPWHHLVHREFWVETHATINLFHIVRGPWYGVINAYTFAAVLIGVTTIVRTWPHANRTYRRHLLALGFTMALPMGTHLWRLSSLNPWPGFDPVPIAFIAGMLGIFWTIWHDRLTRVAPVALDVLFKTYQGGLLIADTRRNIVDMNPASEALLAASAKQSIGQPLEDVLSRWPDIVALCSDNRHGLCEFTPVSGEDRHFEAVWQPLEGADGRSRGFVLALHDISERKKHEKQLRELLDNRTRDWRRATASALKAGEDEQDRIGRELYTILCPDLIAVSRQIKSIASEFTAQPDVCLRLYEAADRMGALARNARNLSHLLARPDLTHASFKEYVEAQLSQLEQALGVACELTVDRHFPPLDAERASHLIRIMREAVTNAAQHASARRIWIDCLFRSGFVHLSIASDGTPLPPQEQIAEGLGLRQMRMRANLLGATLSLEPGTDGAGVVRLQFRLVSDGPERAMELPLS